jgi:hypothetical protein
MNFAQSKKNPFLLFKKYKNRIARNSRLTSLLIILRSVMGCIIAVLHVKVRTFLIKSMAKTTVVQIISVSNISGSLIVETAKSLEVDVKLVHITANACNAFQDIGLCQEFASQNHGDHLIRSLN